VLLFTCAVLSLAIANSAWGDSYLEFFQRKLTIGVDDYSLSKPLLLWINDGLMALFFFVVGLEIKREVLTGELSSPQNAMLSIAGAIGGMVMPTAIYWTWVAFGASPAGWSVPIATDIAFVVGVLAVLGDRVPIALKVFLTALAIVDDLGAILVIGIFYTPHVHIGGLLTAAVVWLLAFTSGRRGFAPGWWFLVCGLVMWVAVLLSGVHATIAGVMLAFAVPHQARLENEDATTRLRAKLDADNIVFSEVLKVAKRATSPLERWEKSLHAWSLFLIMPVFALANAGVALRMEALGSLANLASAAGVASGLLLGKFIGVFGAAWLAVGSGIARLPRELGWTHIAGGGFLAGIGFTMSLFIANLAFQGSQELESVKLSVLAGSVLAMAPGVLLLLRASKTQSRSGRAK
jgi:NhaA family Na+:H+ antiporter